MDGAEVSRALRDAASVEPLGPGRYGVTISPEYTIPGGYPNGGYLQCVMANGALAAASAEGSPHLHATSVSTNYIGGLTTGPAELHCDVRRIGRGDDSALRYMDASPPDIASLDECRAIGSGHESAMSHVLECRLDPSSAKWVTGEVSERGEVKGWLRLDDGDASWSAWSLLLASDAMVPGTFPLGSSGWVPTLQLTSYVRRIPVGEWLRVRQWCVVIADGLVDERCELFDDRDELVASSTQIAMVRFPSTP
jgi:acyl-coenzyme A thioesterase PaaI-like protein